MVFYRKCSSEYYLIDIHIGVGPGFLKNYIPSS